MKHYTRIFPLVVLGFFVFIVISAGCSEVKKYVGPKYESISYDEKIFNVIYPLNIEIIGQTGNIEVYNWDEKAVKFEITKKIKDIKNDNLNDKLKNFKIIADCKEEKDVLFEWKYEGPKKGVLDQSIDLKVYLPKKVESIKCRLDIGKIKIYDDLKCDIFADLNMVNIEINRFEGKLNLKGEMSNLKLSSGMLKSRTEVKINMGNINIKAEYEINGSYYFETKMGNVDLVLPLNSMVSFENTGYVQVNEFKAEGYPTKIKVKSDMGRICINKY
ncbi:MAG: hypothetical protein HPY74_07565 [Firmicutes bacterium]|nr:hypothetical protein [Bacillota bacterium]